MQVIQPTKIAGKTTIEGQFHLFLEYEDRKIAIYLQEEQADTLAKLIRDGQTACILIDAYKDLK